MMNEISVEVEDEAEIFIEVTETSSLFSDGLQQQ